MIDINELSLKISGDIDDESDLPVSWNQADKYVIEFGRRLYKEAYNRAIEDSSKYIGDTDALWLARDVMKAIRELRMK